MDDEDEINFLFYFRIGQSWQQVLLYIYKNCLIEFRRSDFEDHYDVKDPEISMFLPSKDRSENICFEEEKEYQNQKGNFMANEGIRKNSEMNLLGNEDMPY